VPDFAEQALCWQGGANALAWAVGPNKRWKDSFKGAVAGD
jgi:hypothetical protein